MATKQRLTTEQKIAQYLDAIKRLRAKRDQEKREQRVLARKQPTKDDEESLYQAVGQRIRARRRYLDITQVNFAKAVGVSRTSITNIEGGTQRTALHVLYRIAKLLRCSVKDLVP